MPGLEPARESIPSGSKVIEIHVAELKNLFNDIDPSPFREKDLDPEAEDFIVGWARDLPRESPLALVVHVDRASYEANAAATLRDAVREFFADRADAARQRLRQLLRVGRKSLLIGLAILALTLVGGHLIALVLRAHAIAHLLRESLAIGGWVAMWRPMEIFLYDWWPIRAEARLFDRLSNMPVRIEPPPVGGSGVHAEAHGV